MTFLPRLLRCLALVVGLAAWGGTAHAACSSPAGEAGTIKYASNANTFVFCNGTNWVSMAGWNNTSGGGASLLNELNDVDTSGAGTGSILAYNGSQWVVSSTTEIDPKVGTLTNGKWCTSDGSVISCAADAPLTSASLLTDLADVNTTGVAEGKILAYDAATTSWVISDSAVGSTALGDRITSGTHAVTVNTASGFVSLSTSGTDWGYLSGGLSYLPFIHAPTVSATLVSATNISGTLIQVGSGNGATCDAGRRGAIRYSDTSSTVEYCNSSVWVSMGPSATVIPTFAVVPSGMQSIPANTVETLMEFGSKEFDTNLDFNTSTHRFTPTVTGYYHLNVAAGLDTIGANKRVFLRLRKNGNIISTQISSDMPNARVHTATISNIVYANGTTDYFDVTIAQTDTVARNALTGNYSRFSGALISIAGGGGGGGGGGSDNLGNHTAEQDLQLGAYNIVGTGQVSVTNISATYLQLNSPTTVLSCGAGFEGAMRYTSGTMQVCDGSNWGNIGIGVPTGTISAFAASSCPSGWSEYTPSRGRFLRGIDNGAGNDPAGTRAPGNAQADALQNITGTLTARGTNGATPPYAVTNGSGAFSVSAGSSAANLTVSGGNSALHSISFDASTVVRTSDETRPKNVAVIFCVYSGFQSAPGQTILTTLASLTDVSVGGAAPGQALVFDGASWIASDTAAVSTAEGDRITSGTHAVTANTSSGYVSLSTGGTTWGYLGSSASYLPRFSADTAGIGSVSTQYASLTVNVAATDDGDYRSAVFGAGNGNMGKLEFRHGVNAGSTVPRWSSIQAWSNALGNPKYLLLNPNGGNVGISTTTPRAKLDVNGTISASDAIQVGTSGLTCGASIPGAIRYQGTSLQYCNGTTWTTLGSAGAATAASSTGAIQFNSGNVLDGDTNNFFWDNANKRLGIGTVTPTLPFEVNSPNTTTYMGLRSSAASPLAVALTAFDSSAAKGYLQYRFPEKQWRLFADGGAASNVKMTVGVDGVGIGHPAPQSPTATLQVSGSFRVSSTQTGNAPALYAGIDGNVGIGTDAPASRLTVSGGNILLDNPAYVATASQGMGIKVPNAASRGYSLLNAAGVNLMNLNVLTDVNGDLSYGFIGKTHNNAWMTFNNAGNVGIGTTAPSSTLHVRHGTSGKTFANNAGLVVETNGIANTSFVFQAATGGNADAFSITNGGRVGIGTSVPTTQVEIVNTVNSYGLSISSTVAAGDGILVKTAGDTANNGFLWTQGGQTMANLFSGGTNQASLYLYDGPDIGVSLRAGNTASYISNGSFGIGTTSPGRVLHISNTTALIRLQDSDGIGAAANPYIEFFDGAGSRTGYVGDGSSGNANMYLLSENGNVLAMSSGGTCTYSSGASWSCSSDARMKDRIIPLAGSLEKIIQLQGVSYHWRDVRKAKAKHVGLIAQDVQKVFPEVVRTNEEDGMLQVDYAALVSPLIEAVKDLKSLADAIASKLDRLAETVAGQDKQQAGVIMENAALRREVAELKMEMARQAEEMAHIREAAMLGRIEMKNAARELVSATLVRDAANDNNTLAIDGLRKEVEAIKAAQR